MKSNNRKTRTQPLDSTVIHTDSAIRMCSGRGRAGRGQLRHGDIIDTVIRPLARPRPRLITAKERAKEKKRAEDGRSEICRRRSLPYHQAPHCSSEDSVGRKLWRYGHDRQHRGTLPTQFMRQPPLSSRHSLPDSIHSPQRQ